VITSSLDHPLGVAAAAWSAGLALRSHPLLLESCGLLSFDVYEADAFSRRLGSRKSRLVPPAGRGFGFDEELEALPWKRL
jgi:hypothetical protein